LLAAAGTIPFYFSDWLGGFIEAEGSFSQRITGNYSSEASIGKNYDYYLIEAIRNFYELEHLNIVAATNCFVAKQLLR
jgi:hypothetical protein